MAKKKSLSDTLQDALDKRRGISKILKPLEEKPIVLTPAKELCRFLANQSNIEPLLDREEPYSHYGTPLHDLAMVFQCEATGAAREHLRAHGLPELVRLADQALRHPEPNPNTLSAISKVIALYGYESGLDRIAEAVRRFPDEYLTAIVFEILSDHQEPFGVRVVEMLSKPLPTGFAAVCLLDLANTLSRQGRLKKHPFDNKAGYDKLEAWLASGNPEEYSYAHSSAAALPFLKPSASRNLSALAMDHVDGKVQMEAAWASAYRGGKAGLEFLKRKCLDVNHSKTAQVYLDELGKADLIPRAAQMPHFQAMSDMCSWLAHPSEFGLPPDEVNIFDARTLHWLPTDDSRDLWLIRYRYKNWNNNGTDEVGIGMVGSITFSLFGLTNAKMKPEDIYGLHCCWELEVNGDPRAPKRRSAKAGRKLLGI